MTSILKCCSLVLEATEHIRKGLNASKSVPKWEEPYFDKEAYDSCYSKSFNLTQKIFCLQLFLKLLKLYYHWKETKNANVDFLTVCTMRKKKEERNERKRIVHLLPRHSNWKKLVLSRWKKEKKIFCEVENLSSTFIL